MHYYVFLLLACLISSSFSTSIYCELDVHNDSECTASNITLLAGENITFYAPSNNILSKLSISISSNTLLGFFVLTTSRYLQPPQYWLGGYGYEYEDTPLIADDTYFVVLNDEMNITATVTYKVRSDVASNSSLLLYSGMFLLLCAVALAIFVCCLRFCCCCCPPSVPNTVPFALDHYGHKMYVYEPAPYPLFAFITKFLSPITSRFLDKPISSFMVYNMNTNDILWVVYPPVTETLSLSARVGVTLLSFLFIITFQGTWSQELIQKISSLGSATSLIASTAGSIAVTYVVISLFKVVLRPVMRRVSFKPSKMIFASSDSQNKKILGIFLNFFIIISAAALGGLCIFAAYQQGLNKFCISFILFIFTIISRLLIPGVFISYALFRVYGTLGGYPNVNVAWVERYKAHYVQRREEDKKDINTRDSSFGSPSSPSLSSSPVSLLTFLENQASKFTHYQQTYYHRATEQQPLLAS